MHLGPEAPTLPGLEDEREECRGWSKPVKNRHGVPERACKCGRARIAKLERRGDHDLFVPILDGETLPPYYRLAEAKEAVEAAARGDALPKTRKPAVNHKAYRNVGDEVDAEAQYERTKAWFQARMGQARTTESEALAALGLAPGATTSEIKTAVRRLKMEFHPDRNPSDEAVERFRQVTEAAELLLAG